MAVRNRQSSLGADGGRAFTTRIPTEYHKIIEDYSWEKRMSFGAVVRELLLKAIDIVILGESTAKKQQS